MNYDDLGEGRVGGNDTIVGENSVGGIGRCNVLYI
jgi:hypothetical protein